MRFRTRKRTNNVTPKTSIKDILAISISIVALIVSLGNFYYTNLRVSESLCLRILHAYADNKNPKSDFKECPCHLIVVFSLSNNGNRAERLTRIDAVIQNADNKGIEMCDIIYHELLNDSTGILVQPGEVKTFKGVLRSDAWKSYVAENFPENAKSDKFYKEWFAKCELSTQALNSKGDHIYKNNILVIDSIRVNTNDGLDITYNGLSWRDWDLKTCSIVSE
jgi:hypothetical protein